MNKRFVTAIMATLVMIAVVVLASQFFIIDDMPSNIPANFGSYEDSGYYKIAAQTILSDLNRGKTDVFMPLLGNPDDIPDSGKTISWTMSEYLNIANALNQALWGEPLDLKTWQVYSMIFGQDCIDKPNGFNEFRIAYYRTVKVGWKIDYSARFIEMEPWHGVVRWGGNEIFTAPLLFGWHIVDILKFKVSADAALQIAEENGGKEARLGNSKCGIYVADTPNTNIYGSNWTVDYSNIKYMAIINPYNGSVKIDW